MKGYHAATYQWRKETIITKFGITTGKFDITQTKFDITGAKFGITIWPILAIRLVFPSEHTLPLPLQGRGRVGTGPGGYGYPPSFLP